MIIAELGNLDRLLAAITPDQEVLPTPCDEFDVRVLRLHLLGWLGYFEAAFSDPAGDERPDPSVLTGSVDPEVVIGKLTATVQAALDGGAATTFVNVPRLGGVYPGSTVVDLLLIEVLGHGWDLARATGLPWQPPAATCEHALGVLRAVVLPEYRGPGQPFGPEVPVRAAASALDRFVAFTGRDPGWGTDR